MRLLRLSAIAVAATVIAMTASALFAERPPRILPQPLPTFDEAVPFAMRWSADRGIRSSQVYWDIQVDLGRRITCEEHKRGKRGDYRWICARLATAPWVVSIKDNLEQNILAAVAQLPSDLAATEVVKTLEQRVTVLEAEVAALRDELAAR